jgi:xanthine/uracil permease
MAESTGPILAVGGITMLNRSVFNDEDWDWRIPIATAISVGLFAALEKPFPKMTVALAWLAVAGVSLGRVDPKVPSPAESALEWFEGISKS